MRRTIQQQNSSKVQKKEPAEETSSDKLNFNTLHNLRKIKTSISLAFCIYKTL
jgi:hypothetical protein